MPEATDRELTALAEGALTRPASEALSLLAHLGFTDPGWAIQALDRLAGESSALTPLPATMLVELARTGNPDQGLRHLDRYVAATGARTALYRQLVEDPALAQGLARLLGHSGFLADLLVRDPEQLYRLFEGDGALEGVLDRHALRRLVLREASAGDTGERLDHLRRAQRRELLRLGAAEVLGRQSVIRTGRELSALADAVLAIALELVQGELVARYGRPRGPGGQLAQFGVVALGKLGGGELNFSSDIDLMFVYDEDGEARRGPAIANAEFFTRLGEGLIQALTATTSEGFLYRADMRLRPEGASGPLVRSLRSCWLYYETRGELWERQMLIKSRAAAGSARLWSRFHRMLGPFVYPAHLGVRPQDEIRRVKERIEARIQDRPEGAGHLKLQAGGIRDVEFVVQCLQLLNGRVNPRVRVAGTVEGIARLRQAGVLGPSEAAGLRRAYLFFRRLENLVQAADGRQTYILPAEPAARLALARLCGLADAAALETQIEQHRVRVRRVFDTVFGAQPVPTASWGWLLDAEPGAPAAAEALAGMGFADGPAAHRHLLRLAGTTVLLSQSREHLEALLPELLASLAATPDPEAALVRLVRLIEAYGAPGTFLELMHEHPGFRRFLVILCGSSRYLCELIRRDPGLLDSLARAPRLGNGPLDLEGVADPESIRACRNRELVRIGADDLLGLAAPEETYLRLSELAETVLSVVLRGAWAGLVRRHGRPRDRQGRPAAVACMAAGKLGGREMDFGSDLDLLFVYAGEGTTGRDRTTNQVFYTELAQEVIRRLQEAGLYRVDARLRPEGGSAPMVISLTGYRRYLSGRAAAWERLALSRARPVGGDPRLGRQVQRAIERFVFGRPVDAELVAGMAAIRRRMEPRPERGRVVSPDLKRGPGGMVDVEFIAQLLQLEYGRTRPALRSTGTRQTLHRLMEHGLLPADEGEFLLEAYDRLRAVTKAMRIDRDQGEETLPEGRELEVLARAVGRPDGTALKVEVEALMQETRRVFERFFGNRGELAGPGGRDER